MKARVGSLAVMAFTLAYLALGTSLLVTATALPFVVVLLVTDVAHTWGLLALTAPLLGPAISGAYAVFAGYSSEGAADVAHSFFRGWRVGLRRSLALGALFSALLTVLAADVVVLWGQPIGAAAIPLLATGIMVTAATAPVALLTASEHADSRLRDVLKASLYAAIRRWYLSLLSLAAMWVFWAILVQAPALALGVLVTPALYLVWANARNALHGVLAAQDRASGV